MARKAMVVHKLHGSDANLLSRSAVYTLAFSGVTGGSMSLSFNGQTTPAIPSGASTPTLVNLAAALGALSTVGVGNVAVTGTPGGPYTISFVGALQDTPIIPSVDGTNLTGSTPTATLTYADEDFDPFDNADGMSYIPNGRRLCTIYNLTGGSPRTLTVPSSVDAQNRLNDALINAITIPSPGKVRLPKFVAKGWVQTDGTVHLNASGAGLAYDLVEDPDD